MADVSLFPYRHHQRDWGWVSTWAGFSGDYIALALIAHREVHDEPWSFGLRVGPFYVGFGRG